jgi:hypothetical protein
VTPLLQALATRVQNNHSPAAPAAAAAPAAVDGLGRHGGCRSSARSPRIASPPAAAGRGRIGTFWRCRRAREASPPTATCCCGAGRNRRSRGRRRRGLLQNPNNSHICCSSFLNIACRKPTVLRIESPQRASMKFTTRPEQGRQSAGMKTRRSFCDGHTRTQEFLLQQS